MDTALVWFTNFIEDRHKDFKILQQDYKNLFQQDTSQDTSFVSRVWNRITGAAKKTFDDFTDPLEIQREKKKIAVTARFIGAGLQVFCPVVRIVFNTFSRPSLLELSCIVGFFIVGHDLFKWAVNLEKNSDAVRPLHELSNESRLTLFEITIKKQLTGQPEKETGYVKQTFDKICQTLSGTPEAEKERLYKEIKAQRDWHKNQYENMYLRSFLKNRAKDNLDSLEKGVELSFARVMKRPGTRKH